MTEQPLDLLTIAQAADLLGCAKSTLYGKILERKIPFIRLWSGPRKSAVRLSLAHLQSHIERNVVEARPSMRRGSAT